MNELIVDLPEPPARPVRPAQAHDAAALERFLNATAARIATGRPGTRPTTAALLRFRADHAATQDALLRDVGTETLTLLDLFAVDTCAAGGHAEYLLRPDLGRLLGPEAKRQIHELCAGELDLQVVVGDGLSAAAVEANVPVLLPAVMRDAEGAGLSVGTPFFVRHARVGIMNDIGALLNPGVVVLLIGERPGLGRAESLSAYLAYRPRHGDTDAERDVVSNIYATGGLDPTVAAGIIVQLAQRMLAAKASGVRLRTLQQR